MHWLQSLSRSDVRKDGNHFNTDGWASFRKEAKTHWYLHIMIVQCRHLFPSVMLANTSIDSDNVLVPTFTEAYINHDLPCFTPLTLGKMPHFATFKMHLIEIE